MKSGFLITGTLIVLSLSNAAVPAGETPFAANSRWTPVNERDGTVTSAARDGDAIVLRGTGSGLASEGGRAVLLNRYIGDLWLYTTMTARLVSLDGGGGKGEAGIRMEVPHGDSGGMEGIGMRLYYRRDGTLHWEARLFCCPVEPAQPVAGLSLPLWLRIEWLGGALVGSYSTDGFVWTPATPELPITFPPWALPALIVSSQGNPFAAHARFDNVWIGAGDADDNGIADGWEMEHFDRLLGIDASADPDGDLTKNADEWLWRMDPKKADLKPRLEGRFLANGDLQLTLPGFQITEYPWPTVIESAATLEGPWERVTLGAPRPPGYWLTATVPATAAHLFFRGSISVP